jgi:hypothetical protein
MSQNLWQVHVGNIGTVHQGNDGATAHRVYHDYKNQSEDGYGRAANETVLLYKNNEIVAEYNPGQNEPDLI